MLRTLMSVLSVALLTLRLAAIAASDARSVELLAQARKALGGESKLDKIHGLSVEGTFRQESGDTQSSGELKIELQLPDRMLRTETRKSPVGDGSIVLEQGVNGDTLLRDARVIGGGPGMMLRMPAPAAGSDAEKEALRTAQADLARTSLMLLLTAPASRAIDVAFAGEAESPDGKADMLDVSGAGSPLARLFLDKSTHRPLMVTYRGPAPRVMTRVQRGAPPEGAASAPAGPPPAPIADITVFLEDYKQVEGIWMPHRLSRSIDGKPSDEWIFKTIKLNPSFKADAFGAGK